MISIRKTDHTNASKDIISLLNMGLSISEDVVSAKIRIAEHRVEGYNELADPFKIVWVPPEIINKYPRHAVTETYWVAPAGNRGAVIGGGWDTEENLRDIADHIKYRAIEQHFFEGTPWDETGIIDWAVKKDKISKVDTLSDDIRTKHKKYYEGIDRMYNDIKQNGYQINKVGPLDHISVHISRDGELIFASPGWHRLCIAKLLELPEIPVLIRARHKAWQQIRERASQNINNYEMVETHPDLEPLYDDISGISRR